MFYSSKNPEKMDQNTRGMKLEQLLLNQCFILKMPIFALYELILTIGPCVFAGAELTKLEDEDEQGCGKGRFGQRSARLVPG